jgi:parvulin-like peptidyl-prolyl isomerase
MTSRHPAIVPVLVLAAGLVVSACGRSKGTGDTATSGAPAPGGEATASAAGGGSAPGEAPADGRPAEARVQGPGAVAGERDPGAVATVAGRPIPYRLYERYLNDNSGEENDATATSDAIKSRLLDQFIDEQMLANEADHLKVAVSEAEVDAYLNELGLTEGDLETGAPEGKEAFRAKVRHGLVLQKVKETAVLKTIHVSPQEVEDELRKRPEAAAAHERLVLRQIVLEDKGAADDARRAIMVEPGKFESIAKEKSVAPDHGQPRAYAAEDLPEDVRAAVGALQPGGVSPALSQPSGFVIFQLVKREEAHPDLAQVRASIESDLYRQKADQVMERYLADLRGKTEIHVNRAILPFRYTGENRN